MGMEKTWRWYGPKDPITLKDIKQTGATGIVTALHEIPIGEIWTTDAIEERKNLIEYEIHDEIKMRSGLSWSVIESIPVHEDIKLGKPNRDLWISKYQESLRNVGNAGINIVCYNFMPVIDWTRTSLNLVLENGAKALEFDFIDAALFDLHILKRKNAKLDYSEEVIEKVNKKLKSISEEQKSILQKNIIAGLPGGQEGYDLEKFKTRLELYSEIDKNKYQENLSYFLKAIIPVAEEFDVKMAIHPDDPPIPLFGLPRIVSTENDLDFLLKTVESKSNGFTMCTGSFGSRADNDLAGMVERFGSKLNFIHLRSVKRFDSFSFYEADHLEGDVDMFNVIKAILKEQKKRSEIESKSVQIPMRPDHGHVILDDHFKKTNPGYSAIGRLKGLSSLTGLEMGIKKSGLI